MGKATIISSLGAGEYAVTLDHGQDVYVAEVARLDAKRTQYNIDISRASDTLDAAVFQLYLSNQRLTAAINYYNERISIWNAVGTPALIALISSAEAAISQAQSDFDADPSAGNAIALADANQALTELQAPKQAVDDAKKAVEDKTDEVNAGQKLVDELRAALNQLKIAQLSTQKRHDTITNLYANEPEETTVWCADFNESLTGDVGTIDLARASGRDPGNVVNSVAIIRPGDSAYTRDTDGILLPTIMLTPESAFNSYALLPGAAKQKPRYRKGLITGTDGDTCTVLLDVVTSTHQDLNPNQSETVICGFAYMNCNGAVFLAGDRVVVAFEECSWENSVVIGFESNPRACQVGLFRTASYNVISKQFINIFWPVGSGSTKLTTTRGIAGKVGVVPDEWLYLYETEEGFPATGPKYDGVNFAATGVGGFGSAPITSWPRSSSHTDGRSGEFAIRSICKNSTRTYVIQTLDCITYNRDWLGQFAQSGINYWQWANNPDPLKNYDASDYGHYWIDDLEECSYNFMLLFEIETATGNVISEIKKSLAIEAWRPYVDSPSNPVPDVVPTEIAIYREIVCNDDVVAVVCGDGTFTTGAYSANGWTYADEKVLYYSTADLGSAITLKSRPWSGSGSLWYEKYAVCASTGFLCVFDPSSETLEVYDTSGSSASLAMTINMSIPLPAAPATAHAGYTNERYFWLDSDGGNVVLFYGHRFAYSPGSVWVVSAYQLSININQTTYINRGKVSETEYSEDSDGLIQECFLERQ